MAVSQTTQEEDQDGSDQNVKGVPGPSDDSGNAGAAVEEGKLFGRT